MGANISNWKLADDSKERRIRFFPTVGHGYNYDRVDGGMTRRGAEKAASIMFACGTLQ